MHPLGNPGLPLACVSLTCHVSKVGAVAPHSLDNNEILPKCCMWGWAGG